MARAFMAIVHENADVDKAIAIVQNI